MRYCLNKIGKKTNLVGQIVVTPEELDYVKAFAREGANSRVTIKDLSDKVKRVEGERDTWKQKYERLYERVVPFLEAVKHAPKRVMAFLKSIMREPPEIQEMERTTPERKRSHSLEVILMIDKSKVEQARNADIIAFLEKYHGFTFAHRGGAYRCEQHKSLAVAGNRLSWYWRSRGLGGFGALDYLVKAENMAFREAVEVVMGIAPTTAVPRHEAPPKSLVLPEKKQFPFACMTTFA